MVVQHSVLLQSHATGGEFPMHIVQTVPAHLCTYASVKSTLCIARMLINEQNTNQLTDSVNARSCRPPKLHV
jgi:hypothetical protein